LASVVPVAAAPVDADDVEFVDELLLLPQAARPSPRS
jgi:hypothetical protein